MMKGASLFLACAVVALACGGSQDNEDTTPTPAQADAAPPDETPASRDESKLKEAQEHGCLGYCDKTWSCAVDDAKATMSAKELEDLNLPETEPVFRQKCLEQCRGSQLSVRQLEVMHKCLQADGTCEEFKTCMDAMSPQGK